MVRFLFRFLGLLLLAAAFAALIVDATRSIAGERVLFFSFGDTARWLAPTWLAATDEAAQARGVGPMLAGIVELPTWLVSGIAGGLLAALGRRPRRHAAGRRAR